MIFSSICVQINTMFTKKEFKVAAVIALFYSCFAFAFTLTEFDSAVVHGVPLDLTYEDYIIAWPMLGLMLKHYRESGIISL